MSVEKKKFAHTIEVVVEAEAAEESLRKVEWIVRAIHESDALPTDVKVHSYSIAHEEGEAKAAGGASPRDHATASEVSMRIRAKHLDAATEAYRTWVTRHRKAVTGINERLGQQGHTLWPLPGSYTDSLFSVFQAQGFDSEITRNGDLVVTRFTGSVSGALALLRPMQEFVAPKSRMVITLHTGAVWRVDFDGERLSFHPDQSAGE